MPARPAVLVPYAILRGAAASKKIFTGDVALAGFRTSAFNG
jgi:hypothetical protein